MWYMDVYGDPPVNGWFNGTSIYKMDDLGCTPIYGKMNIPNEPKTQHVAVFFSPKNRFFRIFS